MDEQVQYRMAMEPMLPMLSPNTTTIHRQPARTPRCPGASLSSFWAVTYIHKELGWCLGKKLQRNKWQDVENCDDTLPDKDAEIQQEIGKMYKNRGNGITTSV